MEVRECDFVRPERVSVQAEPVIYEAYATTQIQAIKKNNNKELAIR